jgi:hypothetical protein
MKHKTNPEYSQDQEGSQARMKHKTNPGYSPDLKGSQARMKYRINPGLQSGAGKNKKIGTLVLTRNLS